MFLKTPRNTPPPMATPAGAARGPGRERDAGWGRRRKCLALTSFHTIRQMFKDENKKAEEFLEAAAQQHEQLQQRCHQLQQKRQR